jgi:hypothetical protein
MGPSPRSKRSVIKFQITDLRLNQEVSCFHHKFRVADASLFIASMVTSDEGEVDQS